MCNDPECRWITIIEDDKTGEKCYIHYKFNPDMTFTELYSEGDNGLRVYAEVLRDGKYLMPKPERTKEEIEASIVMDFAGNLIYLDGSEQGIKLTDEELNTADTLKSIVEDLETIPNIPNIPIIN